MSVLGKSNKKKNRKSQEGEEELLLDKDDMGMGGAAAGARQQQPNEVKLIKTDPVSASEQHMQMMVGQQRYETAKNAAIEEENAVENEYESDSDLEIDEDTREVIKIVNVHKTYLLGIEGVPALRGVNLTV